MKQAIKNLEKSIFDLQSAQIKAINEPRERELISLDRGVKILEAIAFLIMIGSIVRLIVF